MALARHSREPRLKVKGDCVIFHNFLKEVLAERRPQQPAKMMHEAVQIHVGKERKKWQNDAMFAGKGR
jgi:hypothetical protein